MIIGVDGNEANVDKQVGVSVYTFELLKEFKKQANDKMRFNIFLKNPPLSHMQKESDFFKYSVVSGKFMWSRIFLPFHLRFKSNIDVFFAPAHYSPAFLNKPLVVTIHDLSYFYYPDEFLKKDLYKLKNWTKKSIEKAEKIICVSKTTKKDVEKFYGKKDNVEVIYNGYKNRVEKNKSEDILKKNNLKKDKYLLYVGTLQPRKNIQTLIESFAQFSKENNDFKLVIAGKKGWLFNSIFQKVIDYKLEDKVVFTDYVTDGDLIILYKNAFCFIMPSFYEGFGIPLLEAMQYKCPVISSQKSSLPEIGGDACLYFNPESIGDLTDKIIMLKKDKNLKKNLISAGSLRVRDFSWKKCSKETLDVIRSAPTS